MASRSKQGRRAMKAVILAAGIGSRINEITRHIPKAMIEINGEYIFKMMVEALVAEGVRDIVFVVGYKRQRLKKLILEELKEVDVTLTFVANPDYRKTNTMYSLWLAREHLDCDFVYLHGDLIFNRKMLRGFLNNEVPSAVLVDSRYPLDWEDAMKVITHSGEIKYMSKSISVNEMDGVAIGIYKFSHAAGRVLFKVMDGLIKKKVLSNWVAEAINIAAKQVAIGAVLSGDHDWADVDNMKDLRWGRRVGKRSARQ